MWTYVVIFVVTSVATVIFWMAYFALERRRDRRPDLAPVGGCA